MRILVTGGAGFIGLTLVEKLVAAGHDVLTLDKCTYAASPEHLPAASSHRLEKVDICDSAAVAKAFLDFRPELVFHLAAESHVDRSIAGYQEFVTTNVMGTSVLLDAARNYLAGAAQSVQSSFRFLHISTDEVFGSLGAEGEFDETSPYRPNSPYSASKASSDHLVRAWHKTYGLPVHITNCSNNFGPYQHDEKLIPTIVRSALSGAPIPIYGNGLNVRDWLYVEDHVEALIRIAESPSASVQYCIGGGVELTNLEIAGQICRILDRLKPRADGVSYESQITFVEDRLGHDFRYAVDGSKLKGDLSWAPRFSFAEALENTIQWQLAQRTSEPKKNG
jgi:dTDP-glucose 4,6-dehydratase